MRKKILFAFLLFLLIPSLHAQVSEDLVNSIRVFGNERIEDRTIISYIPIREGLIVNQNMIDQSIKDLFQTGLFADVSMAIQDNILIIQIKENPIVNRVIFNGNKSLKTDKFTEEIQLSTRQVFTQAKLRADIQRILDLYKTSGRFAVKITPKSKQLSQNRVDIVFDIDEGPVSKISLVNFIGNVKFDDSKLSKVILTHQKVWWRFFSKYDRYDPQRIEYDQELLRQFYLKNGYADFRVVYAVSELSTNKEDFIVTFSVDEGEQYKINDVSVELKNEKISEDFLESLILLDKGEIYNYELIEDTIEAMTYTSGAAGYAFVDIIPQIMKNPEDNTIDVNFVIDEGPRVYVDRIEFKGNSSTLDYVIRREMRLAEGDAYNKVVVDRSEQRLKALDYFEEISVEEIPTDSPEKIDLEFDFVEKPTGSLNFSIGFSTLDTILGQISYSERNFLGRGQNINLVLNSGYRSKQFQFSFSEPYFLDRNLSAGFSVFANDLDYRESGIIQKSFGATASLGFQTSEYSVLRANYSLAQEDSTYAYTTTSNVSSDTNRSSVIIDGAENVIVTTTDLNGDPLVDSDGNPITRYTADICDFVRTQFTPTCLTRGKRLKSELGYNFSYDRRDDPIHPTKGIKFSVGQAYAGLGGDANYLKNNLSFSAYSPIAYGVVGAFKLNAGAVLYDEKDSILITDRYFRGGTSFRGFDVAGVGPRYLTGTNQRGQSLGGDNFAVASLEFLVPLPLPKQYGLKTVLFYEFGSVWGIDDYTSSLNDNLDNWFDYDGDGVDDPPIRFDDSLRSSYGISIGWNSPLGRLRLDYAIPQEYEDYDQLKNFRIGGGLNF